MVCLVVAGFLAGAAAATPSKVAPITNIVRPRVGRPGVILIQPP